MLEDQKKLDSMRQDAATIFNSALSAVNAFSAVKKYCRLKEDTFYIDQFPVNLKRCNNIYIIGAGKASAFMGAAIEEILSAKITDGVINVKYDHTVPLKKIKLVEAGHPIPDENGRTGALQILHLVEKAKKNDLIICLISGGGSALLPLPAPPLTLADKQKTIRTLLSCGATINEINALRKHMSLIKGGRLAEKAWPATLITLIVSDVVGNPLNVIASGPTVGDPSTFHDGMDIIRKYDIINRIPPSVAEHFKKGIDGKIKDTPKPGDRTFDKTFNLIIGSNIEALSAARKISESLGYNTLILSSMIEGDTREAAHFHTAIAKEIRKTGNPVPLPACILSGGETTVILKGNGKGGRNQEFALMSALDIKDENRMAILSGGTDGTDGPTDAAGAIIDSNTIEKALDSGLNPVAFLENNDSYHFFQKTGDLLKTGATGTNVMDLRIVLVK
ncbi:MAG: glycerate kinase [Desulfobacteraceae bacterium]|nr:glycerate kinase [Desulfobacteraceae bacterium]MBC2756791.1 glycerate kinase [Desulfobacteraceae bacterium]